MNATTILDEYKDAWRTVSKLIASDKLGDELDDAFARVSALEEPLQSILERVDGVCEWTWDSDEFARNYKTKCQRRISANPLPYLTYLYCPYCGKRIEVVDE